MSITKYFVCCSLLAILFVPVVSNAQENNLIQDTLSWFPAGYYQYITLHDILALRTSSSFEEIYNYLEYPKHLSPIKYLPKSWEKNCEIASIAHLFIASKYMPGDGSLPEEQDKYRCNFGIYRVANSASLIKNGLSKGIILKTGKKSGKSYIYTTKNRNARFLFVELGNDWLAFSNKTSFLKDIYDIQIEGNASILDQAENADYLEYFSKEAQAISMEDHFENKIMFASSTNSFLDENDTNQIVSDSTIYRYIVTNYTLEQNDLRSGMIQVFLNKEHALKFCEKYGSTIKIEDHTIKSSFLMSKENLTKLYDANKSGREDYLKQRKKENQVPHKNLCI